MNSIFKGFVYYLYSGLFLVLWCNMFIVTIILYQLFGFLLVSAGVSPIDDTGHFFALLGILVVVDILSYWNALRGK